MIEKTQAFKTSDGTTHIDLRAAQKHELIDILKEDAPDSVRQLLDPFVELILDNSPAILAILNAKVRKPRTPKSKAEPKKSRKSKDVPATDATLV